MKRIFGGYTSRLLFIAAFIAAVNMTFLSCGKGPDEEQATSTGIQSTVQEIICPASVDANITVNDEVFTPQSVTVPAGGIVKWTNVDDNMWYWVISENVPGGTFTITAINPGQMACLRFTATGTYEYHCDPEANGTIIVQ